MKHPVPRSLILVFHLGVALASAAAFGQRVNYNGGPVISQVRPVIVFWGNNVDPRTVANIQYATAMMVQQPYFGWLNADYNTQFAGGTGQQVLPGFCCNVDTISPYVHTDTLLQGSDIVDELDYNVRFGHLPAATANTVYMVYFPAGYKIAEAFTFFNRQTTCENICGFHGSGMIGGVNAAYAVLPDHSVASCGTTCERFSNDDAFDALTVTASHELMEAVTDPFPFSGWSTDGEIGDRCETLPPATIAPIASGNPSVWVQPIWSNVNNVCLVEGISADSGEEVTVVPGTSSTYGLTSSLPTQFALSTYNPLPGVTMSLQQRDAQHATLVIIADAGATGNGYAPFTAYSTGANRPTYSLDMDLRVTCAAGTSTCPTSGQCVANPSDTTQCPPPPPPEPFDCSSCECGCTGTRCVAPVRCGASCAKIGGTCDPCLGCQQ